jgi:hypothetical protein
MSAAHAGANTSNLRALIAALVAAGEIDEARTMAQRLMELVPTFRLSTFRARTPLRGEVRDRFRRSTPAGWGAGLKVHAVVRA